MSKIVTCIFIYYFFKNNARKNTYLSLEYSSERGLLQGSLEPRTVVHRSRGSRHASWLILASRTFKPSFIRRSHTYTRTYKLWKFNMHYSPTNTDTDKVPKKIRCAATPLSKNYPGPDKPIEVVFDQ